MAVHVEQVVQALRTTLQEQLATACAQVSLGKTPPLAVTAPDPSCYFIGAPSRYRLYKLPCVFLPVAKLTRPAEGTGREWGNIQEQAHYVECIVRYETSMGEEFLELMGYRYAEAVNQVLHEKDIIPETTSADSTKVFVLSFDFGAALARAADDPFRQDMSVHLLIKQWGLLTP